MTTTTIAPIMHVTCPNCTALIDVPEPAMRTNEYYCDVCGWASGDDAPTPTTTFEPTATIDELDLMLRDIADVNPDLSATLRAWLGDAGKIDSNLDQLAITNEIMVLIDRIHTEMFAPDLFAAWGNE